MRVLLASSKYWGWGAEVSMTGGVQASASVTNTRL